MKQLQYHIACVEEGHHQGARDESGFDGTDGLAVFLQIDNNRDGADDVYHGEEHDERARGLLPIECGKHSIQGIFCKDNAFLYIRPKQMPGECRQAL